MSEILVLAGRRDAVALGDALGACVLRLRSGLPVPERDVPGPFDAALARGWRGVICASHRFDQTSGARVAALYPDLPLVHVLGTMWGPDTEAYDTWTQGFSVEEAVEKMPARLRVFAATGRESEAALAQHGGPVFLRQNHLHNEAPLAPNIRFDFASGAYDEQSEAEHFHKLGIQALLARNIGGTRGYGKVQAARRMSLPIYMLEPRFPDGEIAAGVEGARDWVERLCD